METPRCRERRTAVLITANPRCYAPNRPLQLPPTLVRHALALAGVPARRGGLWAAGLRLADACAEAHCDERRRRSLARCGVRLRLQGSTRTRRTAPSAQGRDLCGHVRPGASVRSLRATPASLLRAVRTRGTGQLAQAGLRRYERLVFRCTTSLSYRVKAV